VLSKLLAATALAPALWGTTYLATTELLPPDRPMLAAVLRALPAGLLLLAVTRELPRGAWWVRALVLGVLNIGAFFALLFVAAYRLPGGVAATVGAVQPLLVAALSAGLLGRRLTTPTVLAGAAGVGAQHQQCHPGDARLDGVGVLAALGGAAVMATGVVLAQRWASPATALATTSWQLVAGGLVLVPLAVAEGPLPTLTATNVLGYGYLSLLGTAVAYAVWFRGLRVLPATAVTFLGLLSPVVAAAAGWAVAGQSLTAGQLGGAAVVLGALVAGQLAAQTTAKPYGSSRRWRASRSASASSSRVGPSATTLPPSRTTLRGQSCSA
jgi:probable blue pigment (indigoidine) exporter